MSLNGYHAGPESGGLFPLGDCSGGDQPGYRGFHHPGEPFGEFGWPCAIGGSVSVIQNTAAGTPLKCLVFYLPERPGVEENVVGSMIDRFRRALQAAARLQPRLTDPKSGWKVGLMNLALDIEEYYVREAIPDITLPLTAPSIKTAVNRLRLRGIAIIASKDERVDHGISTEECTIFAPSGSLVVESIPVPFDWDLNRQLRLMILHVVTVPSKWSNH